MAESGRREASKHPRARAHLSAPTTGAASAPAAVAGLPVPGTVPSQPHTQHTASHKRAGGRRRKKAAAVLLPTSSGEAQSPTSSSSLSSQGPASQTSRRPSGDHFEAAVTHDLDRYGMNLTAPRKSRRPPRDRSSALPAAAGQQPPPARASADQGGPVHTKVGSHVPPCIVRCFQPNCVYF